MNFIKLFVDFSIYLTALPVIIAHIRFRYVKHQYVYLYLLIFISIFIELVNFLFSKFGQNNLYLFRFYTILEFTLISLFYAKFLKRYINVNTIYGMIPIFIFIAVIDYKLYGKEQLDSLAISVESIIFICYALYLFYYIMKHLIIKNLLPSPMFWFNCAILFYFLGNFFLFTFNNYVLNLDEAKHFKLWSTIHTTLNVIYNILLSIGFWKTKIKSTQ